MDSIAKAKYIAFIAGASVGLLMARGLNAVINHLVPPDPFKNKN